MQDYPVDLDLLSKHLRDKMDAESLSLRAAAEQIGFSPPTLMRLLKGSSAESYPDSKNVFRAASWLGKSVSDLEPAKHPKQSTITDVEVHLRALSGLAEKDKDMLIAMVRAAHDAASQLRKKK